MQREGHVRGPEKARAGLLEELTADRGSMSKRKRGMKGPKRPERARLSGPFKRTLPRTGVVDTCYPGIVINSTLFNPQKFPV